MGNTCSWFTAALPVLPYNGEYFFLNLAVFAARLEVRVAVGGAAAAGKCRPAGGRSPLSREPSTTPVKNFRCRLSCVLPPPPWIILCHPEKAVVFSSLGCFVFPA